MHTYACPSTSDISTKKFFVIWVKFSEWLIRPFSKSLVALGTVSVFAMLRQEVQKHWTPARLVQGDCEATSCWLLWYSAKSDYWALQHYWVEFFEHRVTVALAVTRCVLTPSLSRHDCWYDCIVHICRPIFIIFGTCTPVVKPASEVRVGSGDLGDILMNKNRMTMIGRKCTGL